VGACEGRQRLWWARLSLRVVMWCAGAAHRMQGRQTTISSIARMDIGATVKDGRRARRGPFANLGCRGSEAAVGLAVNDEWTEVPLGGA
jgi:hypothetical protein